MRTATFKNLFFSLSDSKFLSIKMLLVRVSIQIAKENSNVKVRAVPMRVRRAYKGGKNYISTHS